MSVKKNHHFVPQFYLRKFQAYGKGPLFVLNLENISKGFSPKIKPTYPAGICYKEYYYNLDRDLIIEKITRPKLYIENVVNGYYENNIPEIIERILNQSTLNLNEATLLSDFIIHLKIRNPYQQFLNERSKLQKVNEISLKRYDFFKNKAFERGIPQVLFDTFFQNSIMNLLNNENLIQDLQKENLIRKYENPEDNYKKFRDAILSSSWRLLKIENDSDFFLTTDNPGVAEDNSGIIHNTKFLNGFKFYFPLSPKYCLIITDAESSRIKNNNFFIKTDVIDSLEVKKINKLSCSVVNNFIISNNKDWLRNFLDQIN